MDKETKLAIEKALKLHELQLKNPSEVTEAYWISAIRIKGKYPKSTRNSGKWLVFVDISNLDETWAKIKEATEKGKLGGSSKTSTAKESPNAFDENKKVICVYTYDHTDEKDVMRIRKNLEKLGITQKIPYKTDQKTIENAYQKNGSQRISKYYK
jgi:hypothetical protein